MFRLIGRIEKAILNGIEFVNNVFYYLGRQHRFKDAVQLARDTLPR